MRIKKMTATFGCLNGAELTFNEGLNVITAANESGKSTWCAFMRAMLYGVDSAERPHSGSIPDKQKYAPWSGAPMEGTMELISGGREMTLCRKTRMPSAPMREFSAVYTGTNEPVPGLTGRDVGTTLTGISAEVMRRSAFISQGELAVSGAPELERRISSVVSSGEEGTSFSEADARLRAWQRKRQFNNRGAIPELETEIERQRRTLGTVSSARGQRETLSMELEAAKRQKAELDAEIERFREETGAQNKLLLDEARAERGELEDALRAAKAKCAMIADGLDEIFAGMEPFEAYKAVDADIERMNELCGGRRPHFIVPVIFALLAAAAAVGGYMFFWHAYFAAAVFALAAVISFIVALSSGSEVGKKAALRSEILEKYHARDEEGVISRAEAYSAAYKNLKEARETEAAAAAAFSEAEERRSALEKKLLDGPEAQVRENFGSASEEAARRVSELSTRLAELGGRTEALGDPADIETEIAERERRKSELEEQYSAIAMAMETLQDADGEMQTRFSPRLAQTAAKYMKRLTDGRYSDVTLSRDLNAMTRLSGDSVPHESGYMSMGAADLLYLSVRLAVCELALPDTDPCPLIIDDALVNFDPEREERVMDLLHEIAAKRQVILFTCK